MKTMLWLVGLTTILASPALAQIDVKLMVPGLDKQIYITPKLAESLGYFKEQGLNVTLFNSNSGSQAATALLAREVQAVVGSYDHTIDLQSKGKMVISIAQLAIAPGEVELVATGDADALSKPENWKGKAVGVTGLGSATDFLTRFMAQRAGLKPQDYSIIPVGAGDTLISALQQNKIVAGMTTEPTVGRAVKMGVAKVGIDLRTPEATRAAIGGWYPFASLNVEAAWLATNKETAQKLVTAFVKTLKWMHSHSPDEIADKMPKDYFAGDRDLYVAGLKDGMGQYSPDGMMPAGAPEDVLNVQKAFNPSVRDKTIDLSKTYTTEFVRAAAIGQ
jgi:NitT/TauT family transport system substrate-binding protein